MVAPGGGGGVNGDAITHWDAYSVCTMLLGAFERNAFAFDSMCLACWHYSYVSYIFEMTSNKRAPINIAMVQHTWCFIYASWPGLKCLIGVGRRCLNKRLGTRHSRFRFAYLGFRLRVVLEAGLLT